MARPVYLLLAIACASSLSACGSVGEFIRDDINKTLGKGPDNDYRRADLAAAQVTTIGVNSYLWRAALDTLSFAPLAQVDSAGGVIVTDWYSNPNAPGDRVKVTATIMEDRKSTRLNSSHANISYAVFCLKKNNITLPCTSAGSHAKTRDFTTLYLRAVGTNLHWPSPHHHHIAQPRLSPHHDFPIFSGFTL